MNKEAENKDWYEISGTLIDAVHSRRIDHLKTVFPNEELVADNVCLAELWTGDYIRSWDREDVELIEIARIIAPMIFNSDETKL